MLKIVYPNCCGIDVHKTFVVAVIAITDDQGITQYHRRRFSTFTNQLKELRKWLDYYSCFHVCMESTGKYWIPVYNILEPDHDICLAHLKYIKAIRGKNRQKGCPMDCQFIQTRFSCWKFYPASEIRQLRDLFRYYNKLTSIQTSKKNRFQNSLNWSDIQIASVVSDVFGNSAQKMIQSVLDDPSQIPDIETLVHKSMIQKVDRLKLSIEGEISDEQAEKIRVIKAHYDSIVLCKNDLEQLITELAQEYQPQIKLIQTVPGFKKELTSIRLISEIGVDMSKFPTSGHLCS